MNTEFARIKAERFTLSEPYRSRMLTFIHALESGQYAQGQGRLETIWYINEVEFVSHCCLGVLCRIAMADGVELATEKVLLINVERDHYRTLFGDPGRLPHAGHPPDAVLDWLLPQYPTEPVSLLAQRWLIRMNDSWGHAFVEIAQFLRDRFNLPRETTDA